MNIQAEIKWIQNQLNDVTDPDLITVFKTLLKYRKKRIINTDDDFQLTKEHLELLEQAEEKHVNGTSKSYTWEEVKAFARTKHNA